MRAGRIALLAFAACSRSSLDIPPAADLRPTTELALGFGHTCLARDGHVTCWGEDIVDVDLVCATSSPCVVPVDLPTVAHVTAGGEDACALLVDGTLRCWGANDYGELGPPFGNAVFVPPRSVAGLDAFVSSVSMANQFTCALDSTHVVRCFGNIPLGPSDAPATVIGGVPDDVVALATSTDDPYGPGGQACMLDTAGSAFCFGTSPGGLGDGTSVSSAVPVRVASPVPFAKLALGGEHSCALDGEGGVWCWGHNGEGRLGDGTTADRSVPTRVIGLPLPATHVAAGGYHTCALLNDDTVWCWGLNDAGQLGNGVIDATFNQPNPTPSHVAIADVIVLGAGWKHNCVVVRDGSVWCWGINDFGELGIARGFSQPTPVRAEL